MKILLEIDDNFVQAVIFVIVKIFNDKTAEYKIVTEEPKSPDKRAIFQPKNMGR